MLRLYDYWESGNCYKVRLLLHQLEIPFERVHLDILEGETRTPSFLEKNPNHRVPLLEWPDGRRLAESNAILCYLSTDTTFLPANPFERSQVLQWMFFEQYSHEPNIAVLRFWSFYGSLSEQSEQAIAQRRAGGVHALDVMEAHLLDHHFFVGES